MTASPVSETKDEEDVFEGRSTPGAIEGCLRKLDVGEPFEFDRSLNPFYLRLDFYGDRILDYAAVIRGKNSKKLGLLICKDGKEPLILGELSNSNAPLTDMENDNFIGAYWSITDPKELNAQRQRLFEEGHSPNFRVKGEVIVFTYEIDGVLYLWWDGNKIQTFSL